MVLAATLTGPLTTADGPRAVARDVLAAAAPFQPHVHAVRVPQDGDTAGTRTDTYRVVLAAPREDKDEDEDASAGRLEANLGALAAAHGWRLRCERTEVDPFPSPLWNAGLAGPDFERVSRELCSAAMDPITRLAGRLPAAADEAYVPILRLMAAHAAVTVAQSDQLRRQLAPFPRLLALRMLSFRSHYEGFYARVADKDALERRFDAVYQRVGEQARRAVRVHLDGADTGDDAIDRWVELTRTSAPRVRDAFARGELLNAGLSLADLNRDRPDPLPPTRFHAALSPAMESLLHRDPDFLSFRLQTSLMYSSIYTLGFSLPERYLFCYVMARANEDVSGSSVDELRAGLRELAEAVAR